MSQSKDTISAPRVFVVGAQRSGTTMLRLMMNAHPDLGIPFEADAKIAVHDRRVLRSAPKWLQI